MLQLYGHESQRRHLIGDASAIGEARRDAQRLASRLNLDATVAGRIGVVVTELATNVFRHGGGGELMLQALPGESGAVFEVLAVDRGPGMDSIEQCLKDGYSSGGRTPGTGLGAVKRLSAEFDIHSQTGRGTVVMARIGGATRRLGAVCTPKQGESECGDAWRLAFDGEHTSALIVIDGLGHGPSAASAAQKAADCFVAQPFDTPARQLERAHEALAGSRGAAVACAVWNRAAALAYAGIGNIAGRVFAPQTTQGLVSHNGTLGFQFRRVQQFEYTFGSGALLVMHSDGLSARWDLDEHPGLRQRHPAVIAATLHRDHARGRDDSTVVVSAHE
jgi:anti-sigma regulatory factor (Ser/Thr protein kinase)